MLTNKRVYVLIAAMTLVGLTTVHAAETGRYQAIAIDGDDASHSRSRVLILDTVDGHVWTWSSNELMPDNGNGRRYGSAFIYQGKLRPGTRPGEIIDPQVK
jgi:hypothetical protein